MKPYQNYPGGKEGNGTYQTLINWIPPHQKYYELFVGNGAIYRYKSPAPAGTVINDLETGIYDHWNSLELIQTEVTNQPALQLLSSVAPGDRDTFIYADPPYPIFIRKSQQKIYKIEMTDRDHEEFLSMANTVNCNCMISTYDNKMYQGLLKGWNKIQFNSTTRNGTAVETIYMNYDSPGLLHDYSFLGSDCWDRQRIKRKIQRHINRLRALPVHERNAIIGAIQTEIAVGS